MGGIAPGADDANRPSYEDFVGDWDDFPDMDDSRDDAILFYH
jgi:hypothetical protein